LQTFVIAVAELQKQSALECEANKQAIPQKDGTKPNLAGNQLWFINTFKLRQAFSVLAAVAPAFGQMVLALLEKNIASYENMEQDSAKTL
jgi:hypothetical protein